MSRNPEFQNPKSAEHDCADDDPLNVAAMIREAFQVVDGDSVAIVEEALSVQAQATSWEGYVQQYSETFAVSWEQSIQTFEDDVLAWQEETQLREDLLSKQGNHAQDQLDDLNALKARLSDLDGSTKTTKTKRARTNKS